MVSTSDSVRIAAGGASDEEGAQPAHSVPGVWPSTAILTTARSHVAHFFTARVGSGSGLAVLEVCGTG